MDLQEWHPPTIYQVIWRLLYVNIVHSINSIDERFVRIIHQYKCYDKSPELTIVNANSFFLNDTQRRPIMIHGKSLA